MDKFGIFNLINTFLTQYKNRTDEPNQNETSPSVNSPPKKEPVKSQTTFVPLQADMLKTIKEHDSFVKRVLKDKK